MCKKLKNKFINFLARKLPDNCPLERRVKFKGITILYIPPLCQLNHFYDEIIKEKLKLKGYGDLLND